MDEGTKRTVSSVCLRGRPVPRSLELLWDADAETLAERFGITKLLTDLSVLDEGYGDERLKESEGEAAVVRAYRATFEEVGFFAELDGSELLGYWLEPGSAEPPIVKLDTEGTFSWVGADAREALFRLAADEDQEDEGRAWLASAGLDPGALDDDGVSTQLLPSLEARTSERERANRGEPAPPAPNPAAIDAADASTWHRQPAGKVAEVMRELLGGPLKTQCIWTDGTGLVTNVSLDAGLDRKVGALGIRAPTTRDAILATLGKPDADKKDFVSYHRGGTRVNYRFDKSGALESINLGPVPTS
jgi:hypothetical protein